MSGWIQTPTRRYTMPDDYTYGEAWELKDITGLDMLELEPAIAKGNARALVGLLYVAMRRADPSVTLDQVKALHFGDVVFEVEDEVAQDPPSGGGGKSVTGLEMIPAASGPPLLPTPSA